jgi:hypothetical protein
VLFCGKIGSSIIPAWVIQFLSARSGGGLIRKGLVRLLSKYKLYSLPCFSLSGLDDCKGMVKPFVCGSRCSTYFSPHPIRATRRHGKTHHEECSIPDSRQPSPRWGNNTTTLF